MKSQVNALHHVMNGLLKDVHSVYPAIKGLDLDLQRLALYCRTRGLAFYTLDLPNLDALLTQGLETGRLALSGPLSKRVSKRTNVPRFLSGLWLRVFDREACLRQEVDITALFFIRQISRLGKNICVDCSPRRISATMKEYYDVERQLRTPTKRWESDFVYFGDNPADTHLGDCLNAGCRSDGQADFFPLQKEEEETCEPAGTLVEDRRLLDQVQRVADVVCGSMDQFNSLFLRWKWELSGTGIGFKHGPGAVAEGLKNQDKSWFPNWPDKLQGRFRYETCGKTYASDLKRPSRHESPSRLMSVPKTAKSPRLIAAEPTSHMWCQQFIKRYLEEEIVRLFGRNKSGDVNFIDFKRQQASGSLVLRASLDRKLATVDLSSASDRLSCWTVERMFRMNPSLLTALHAARTRWVRDDVSHSRNFFKLKKFATQGTATTFPVQSIVFLCIAIGACTYGEVTMRKIRRLSSQVRVYGDDIIIPTHGYTRLVRIMDLLQLRVNVAKSYRNGNFRESCGTDGFLGYDVTPVSPKTLVADSPASRQAVVDITNNLYCKGLWHASDSCRTLLPIHVQRGLRIVGYNDAGFSGLISYSGSDESHLKQRWNPSLHRYEVRIWSLLDRKRTRDRTGYPVLLDFVSRSWNPEHARISGSYGDNRKTSDGLLWEPLNHGARICTSSQ